MTDDIAQWLIERGEASYYPDGNVHDNEWDSQFIGVSTLVKRTAESYAKRILMREEDERDREGRYWGFLGNALADAHLRQITPYREPQLSTPLRDGWNLIGHADGITIGPDDMLIVNECKAFARPDDADKNDLAHRQAGLYLAMLAQMLAYPRTLPIASFATDPTIKPLTLDEGHTPWGTCLHVSPRFGPPALVEPREMPAAERNRLLDFYTRKAHAILTSVEAGNLDAARAWDRSAEGLTEFIRHAPQIYDGPRTDDLLRFASVKAEADKQQKAEADSKATSNAEILAIMREQNVTEAIVGDYRLKVVGGFDGPRAPYVRVSEVAS